QGSAERLLVLGDIANDSGREPLFECRSPLPDVDSLPANLRADVALVCVTETDDLPVALLARLRDVHAQQIVLHVAAGGKAASGDMLALGFEAAKSPPKDGLVYVWDAALADKPREWNNSRHWANPGNFDRYRW
ncbi:MAG: DUF6231 family protein, partial [Pseudomonadota bacterium]